MPRQFTPEEQREIAVRKCEYHLRRAAEFASKVGLVEASDDILYVKKKLDEIMEKEKIER